ncbi:MAG: hypothetical protein RL748_4018 [Pseudomonadota bacterium]|jgi:hypothetical protein
MRPIKHALVGLILVWASLLAMAQTREAGPEVEYAPAPNAAATEDGATRPRVSKPPRVKRNTTPAAAAPEAASEPPVAAPIPEPVEVLPVWRINIQSMINPFGIDSMMLKMGLSGPAADILGLLILLFGVSIVLFIVLRIMQVVRQQIADQVARKRAEEPVKDEPLMEAGPSRMNTRTGNSRMDGNHRGGPNSRLGANSRGGPDSRMGHNTRSGPDSRMGQNTRGGPDSRMGQNTRGGPDSRMAYPRDSRLSPNTRGGADSRLGMVTLDGNSRMPPDTRSGAYGNAEVVLNAPEGFDKPRFLRKTRVYFLRLQTAWDKSDFNTIRQFAATPVYNELRKQMLERGDTTNCTDVLAIQTELLAMEAMAGNYIATVKFTGMIKETESPAEVPFEEVWRLSHPKDKPGDWVLSGIIQYI